jgi:prepilin-type N-terminal cleavage/methylation domain-containing protein
MGSNRGMTLLEVMVAAVLVLLIINMLWSAIHLFNRGERAGEHEAAMALEEARALELLLCDLRSARSVQEIKDSAHPGGGYRIQRHGLVQGRLQPMTVSWLIRPDSRLVRQIEEIEGASVPPPQMFSFESKLSQVKNPFRFRLERVHDAEYQP